MRSTRTGPASYVEHGASYCYIRPENLETAIRPSNAMGPDETGPIHQRGLRFARGPSDQALRVVVERELVGVGAQPHLVDLLAPLVVQPGLYQVRGEDIALQQELVVLLQGVQDLFQ